MANDALQVNPPSYPIDITRDGSNWLWAAFSVMMASLLVCTVLTFTRPLGKRAFGFFGMAILATASIAYFAMASNLGKTPILAEFPHTGFAHLYDGPADNAYRAIYYARYIDWTITTPLLLMELLLTTGLPLSYIFFTIFADIVMIETGLIGALVTSRYKWGFFAFGCAAMFFVFWVLVGPARKAARALGPDVVKTYTSSALILGVLWFLYPVAWGICEGGNVIPPDSEAAFYGALDVLAKPGFLFFHLWSIRNIEYERFQLQSGHFSTGAIENFASHEKTFHNNEHSNGHANGAANGHSDGSHGNNHSHSNGHPTAHHPDPRPESMRPVANV